MNRREFVKGSLALTGAVAMGNIGHAEEGTRKMKIKQIRNATLRVTFGGVKFLVDPWLVSKAE